MKLVGFPEDNLEFNKKDDDVVEIKFPSMSKFVKKAGRGANWGYVVKMTGLADPSDK